MQEIALIIIGVLVLSMIITIWNWYKKGDFPVSYQIALQDPMFRSMAESRSTALEHLGVQTPLVPDEYTARRTLLLQQLLSELQPNYREGYNKTLPK